MLPATDFMLKSGRILVITELYETYSRSTRYIHSNTEPEIREWLLHWHSDLGRTLDYLESHADEFGSTYTFFGISYGASVQVPLLAMESRFSNAVLINGGITQSVASMRFVDSVHYLPRITVPLLLFGASHDNIFPVQTTQLPFIERLGTPAEHVRRIEFSGAHVAPPRRLYVRETLRWLDKYAPGETATSAR